MISRGFISRMISRGSSPPRLDAEIASEWARPQMRQTGFRRLEEPCRFSGRVFGAGSGKESACGPKKKRKHHHRRAARPQRRLAARLAAQPILSSGSAGQLAVQLAAQLPSTPV